MGTVAGVGTHYLRNGDRKVALLGPCCRRVCLGGGGGVSSGDGSGRGRSRSRRLRLDVAKPDSLYGVARAAQSGPELLDLAVQGRPLALFFLRASFGAIYLVFFLG